MSEQITARPYHKNPRKISAQQVVQLREWLAELGDLGGIVHDLNSGEIISGNQRSFHAFDLAQCEIEITHRLEEPDAQGTVAHGFVLWQGGRYAYRQVRWTAEQCEKANIIANKAGGVWDIETLLSDFEREGLLAWGFSDEELDDLAEALSAEYLINSELPEPPDEWPEYDESAADDVEFLECPECGHKWPK